MFHEALKKKKATHSTVWISFFFLFCLPQPPFTLIINIVSSYLSRWQALRNSCMVKNTGKNIPVSIHTCCHYSFRLPKFFHQNKLLPLSSANPKKLSPLGAHLSCELLSWMRLYSLFSEKKIKRKKLLELYQWKIMNPCKCCQTARGEIINFLVKVLKIQHMGSCVYKFSPCLSASLHVTYILSYSPFIWLSISTMTLAFASKERLH